MSTQQHPVKHDIKNPLYGANDLGPIITNSPNTSEPFLICCEHAGNSIPESLNSLGLSDTNISSHIAWDIGIAKVAEILSENLNCTYIAQRYSRLVIDCNRSPLRDDAIATTSDNVSIPGNVGLSKNDVMNRVELIHRPYHEYIEQQIRLMRRKMSALCYVSLHSFTPSIANETRPWDIGVIYHQDPLFANALISTLRAETNLNIGCNQPYSPAHSVDYSCRIHAESKNIPYAMIEIRNDHISSPEDQKNFANLLSQPLKHAWEMIN